MPTIDERLFETRVKFPTISGRSNSVIAFEKLDRHTMDPEKADRAIRGLQLLTFGGYSAELCRV
jgi:hypothetical protein